jgi:hypothetical protein
MTETPVSMKETLKILDARLKQVKLDYEHYFQGSRPREPAMARAEMQKQFVRLSNGSIKNTADRFRFNSLNSRFMVFKRQWDETLRKMETGTYDRHVFKANLRDRERGRPQEAGSAAAKVAAETKPGDAGKSDDIYSRYVDAARSCGQNVDNLTPDKLQAVIRKQEQAIKEKHGAEKVKFRVEVEGGKVKLKATVVKAA